MFRVKESEEIQGPSVSERVLVVAVSLALLINVGSACLIVREFRRLATWPGGDEAVPISVLEYLRSETRLQLVASLILASILIFCLSAIWWLRRRYLSSQKSLRQVKMLAHNILASMDHGVVTTDHEGVITSVNSASLRLLEMNFDCVGRPLASISPSVTPLTNVYCEIVEMGMTVRDRNFNFDREGRMLRVSVDGHPLKDTAGITLGCVIHLRDVTERMLLEERMRRMERFLGLATLASGLHHEIKNPLTALSIHIQLLEEGLAKTAPRDSVDELVGVLKTEVCRLNGVLESFRNFANLQHLSLRPTDPLTVIEDVIRLIQPQASEQRVQISLLHSQQELPLVPLDAEKIEQVILNLMINALDPMPDGGTLKISAAVVQGEFHISIGDSGSGISPEARKHIFQPYFSTKTKGSGLGLALSEKLINQHGGRIDYRTGPEGTTFEIAVPVEQESGAA
jgi:two-component system sensor histidine kinase HydH